MAKSWSELTREDIAAMFNLPVDFLFPSEPMSDPVWVSMMKRWERRIKRNFIRKLVRYEVDIHNRRANGGDGEWRYAVEHRLEASRHTGRHKKV
jgi:hypothetical protein